MQRGRESISQMPWKRGQKLLIESGGVTMAYDRRGRRIGKAIASSGDVDARDRMKGTGT